MRPSLFCVLLLAACSKRADPTPAASSAVSASSGVSQDVAELTAQTHRDMCAATRELRVQSGREKAQEWLGAMDRIADRHPTDSDKRFKATLDDAGAWEHRPITAYPTGIGAVDTCADEDAKVRLNTTPELGDIRAIKALMAWHP